MNNRKDDLAPCGVFCAACPSFDKTCNGCSSENKKERANGIVKFENTIMMK